MKYASVVTGTSTDGLSISLVDITGFDKDTKVKVEAHTEVPFPELLRKSLLQMSNLEGCNSEFFSATHWALGKFIGERLKNLPWEFDAVCFSGYTVYHGPSLGKRENGTLQIGEVSEILARTGKTVIYDFRTTDFSMGGDGAPLIPLSDKLLIKEKGCLTVNIGGISNITYIGNTIFAFDTGPGNILIDLYTMKYTGKQFDEDGKLASTGKIQEKLLGSLLDDDYFRKSPPKSTGREYFDESYVSQRLIDSEYSKEDIIRTLTRFTASSIHAQATLYIDSPIQKVIVGGGGSLNPVLMYDLEEIFEVPVRTFLDYGIDPKAREGVGFAIIANQTLHGRIGNTEASGGRPSILGKILPGDGFKCSITP